MSETRYKFLEVRNNGALRSSRGNQSWTVGEWYEVDGEVRTCAGSPTNGFHCSKRMSEAFGFVKGEAVAVVEVDGDHDETTDKEAWQRMRLVDVRLWRKADSVALAIFAAELVIDIFERAMPNDDRPRKAIEAAKAYLENPTNADDAADDAARAAAAAHAAAAAYAADAAYAAYAAPPAAYAADAARAAAYAAYAAYAAPPAAYAADAARAAAYAAYAAYGAAAPLAAPPAADAAYAAYAADAARAAADAADAADAAYAAAAYAAPPAADAARAAYGAYAAYELRSKISDWMEVRFEMLPKFEAE